MIYASFIVQIKISRRYIIVVSFISMAFVVGKLHYLPYLGYFWQETWRDHESEGHNKNLIYRISSSRLLVKFLQKMLTPALSSVAAIGHKGHFRKILTQTVYLSTTFLSLAAFLGTTSTLVKKTSSISKC